MTKKTLGIAALDLDCSAKNSLKNTGGEIPDYFTVIDPYCGQFVVNDGILSEDRFHKILDDLATQIEQRMAPKARIIMPLFDNVHQLSTESKQKLQTFITTLDDSGFSLYLCAADKYKFMQNFPDLNKRITDNILDGNLFANPDLAIPFMQRTNKLAKQAYLQLQKTDQIAPVPLTFSMQSRFPTPNHELNQFIHCLMAILFCVSMLRLLRGPSTKHKPKLI